MSANVQLQILKGIIELEKQRNEARAEAVALRRQLAETRMINQWYRPSEKLPLELHEWNGHFEYLTCIGYWPDSGVLAAEYWTPFNGAPFQWKAVAMNKFSWEWRTPPACWCYLPVPPVNMREGRV